MWVPGHLNTRRLSFNVEKPILGGCSFSAKGVNQGRNHWQEEFRLRWLNTVHVVATQAVAAQALAAQSTAVAHGTWIHLRSLKVLPGWGVSTRRMWKTGGNRKLSWVMRKNSSALILLYLKSIWPSYKIGGCSYSAKRVNQGTPRWTSPPDVCVHVYLAEHCCNAQQRRSFNVEKPILHGRS